jgi:hypothetical protein
MKDIVLYCCTFGKDLQRAKRMAESVAKHNRDSISFYLSVPRRDLDMFRAHFPLDLVELICEEDMFDGRNGISLDDLYALPGSVQQQIIKAEFWRLDLCENYLVLDSDCVFIRDFYKSDFLATGDIPFSVIHEGRSYLQPVARFGPKRARGEFFKDRRTVMKEIGREGLVYDFGYAPFIWSRRVWEDLAEKFLAPRGETLLDIVKKCPSELTWYGESLLKFRSIPIWPREELFRHYHYEHQYWVDQKLGYTLDILKRDYLGIVFQSNWQTWEDYGKPLKSPLSRIVRSAKRLIRRISFKLGLLRG